MPKDNTTMLVAAGLGLAFLLYVTTQKREVIQPTARIAVKFDGVPRYGFLPGTQPPGKRYAPTRPIHVRTD